jgi:hypothetical protein
MKFRIIIDKTRPGIFIQYKLKGFWSFLGWSDVGEPYYPDITRYYRTLKEAKISLKLHEKFNWA